MIVFRPSTLVVATWLGSVPLYEVPTMPTSFVVQSARTGCPASSKPRARPFSQSITALVPSVSARPPTSGHPSELNVPTLSPSTTA
jgi:hypothetical protein